MPAAGTPAYDRMVGAGFAVLAIGGFWLAGDHLAGVVRAIRADAPAIVAMRLTAAAPFAAMVLALMAAMLLVQPGKAAQRRIWWAIAACLPGLVIGPIAAGIAADSALSARGYAKCDKDLAGGRHATRWVRSASDCSSSG